MKKEKFNIEDKAIIVPVYAEVDGIMTDLFL